MQNVTLSQLELLSIDALIKFKAYEKETSEDLINIMLTKHFKVQNIKDLRFNDFDNVIRFLVDLDFKRVLN